MKGRSSSRAVRPTCRASVAREGARIAVVQQELSLVPTMSVAENVFLGDTRAQTWRTPRRLVTLAAPYLERVGLGSLDPRQPVGSLSVAERQLVEIARLLARDARVLILDEPTAALSDREIERVMEVVRSVRSEGRSVIYVTHRLGEVFDLADRVTVFRNGRSQPPVPVSELDLGRLVERMLGVPLENLYPPRSAGFGETVLRVRGLETDRRWPSRSTSRSARRDPRPRGPARQRRVPLAARAGGRAAADRLGDGSGRHDPAARDPARGSVRYRLLLRRPQGRRPVLGPGRGREPDVRRRSVA